MAKLMTIGIDASRLTLKEKTGVEVYSHEIIRRLITLPNARYILYSNGEPPVNFDLDRSRQSWKIISPNRLWTQFALAKELFFHKQTDVMFIPSHVIPLLRRGRFVTTIHDVAYLRFPEAYNKSEIRYQKLGVKTALRAARYIIVPSQSTKDDLVTFFKADPEKIIVIHHGIKKFDLSELRGQELPFGISKKFILFTGRLEHKKNLVNLIKAYGFLRQESRIDHQLVLAGKPGYSYEAIEKEINNLPPQIQKDVILTDYVSDRTYNDLMSWADFFVFPSLYEGFGLPVLEAQAHNLAVVANDLPSLREVGGEGAAYIDCLKPFKLAAQISKLIHQPREKAKLIELGQENIKRFRWDKAAEKTFEVLIRAAEE